MQYKMEMISLLNAVVKEKSCETRHSMQNGIAPLSLWNSFIGNNRSRAPLIKKRLSEAPRLLNLSALQSSYRKPLFLAVMAVFFVNKLIFSLQFLISPSQCYKSKILLTFKKKSLNFLYFPCILKAEKHWIKVTLVNFGQLKSREVTGQFKILNCCFRT